MDKLIRKVIAWGHEKGIFPFANRQAQLEKFEEESREFYVELYNLINLRYDNYQQQINRVEDELGDVLVTLVINAEANGLDLKTALDKAYQKINERKGKMVDGKFVKE